MLNSSKKKEFYTNLVDSTYKKMLIYAHAKITDISRANDLVHDTYCTAWENIDRVMKSENPEGWLMNTLKNHMHKFYEELKKEKRIIDALTATSKGEEAYIPVLEKEVSFFNILSADEIQIVKLKEQGYKHHEIAKIMKVKPGTIDSKVSRLKNKISEFLND